jgi:hypothetical protein
MPIMSFAVIIVFLIITDNCLSILYCQKSDWHYGIMAFETLSFTELDTFPSRIL